MTGDRQPIGAPGWRRGVRFGLHFDVHVRPGEEGVGSELHLDDLVELLRQVRPDFVQCDSKGHEGLASWPTEVGTPSPGIVADSLAVYREAARVVGLPLIAHYSGVLDEQAIREHASWAVTHQDGTLSSKATSRFSGYDHDRLIPQLIEMVQKYSLEGVWVDGENWAAERDWSDDAVQRFREATGFGGPIPTSSSDAGWRAWSDFHRGMFRRHVAAYSEAIHMAAPDTTVVSNWMYTLRQPDTMASAVTDYVSGDFSPNFGMEEAIPEAAFLDTRAISWELMIWAFTDPELDGGWVLKSLDQLRLEAGLIMSRGGAVVLYDQPARRGRHRAWHTPLLAGLSDFCRRRDVGDPGANLADVLVLLDADHHYAVSDELFAYSSATDAVRGAALALLGLHVTFDIATTDDEIDWDRYKTIIVPEQGSRGSDASRLVDYVGNGGHLVVTGNDSLDALQPYLGHSPNELHTDPWLYVTGPSGPTPIRGPWRTSALGDAEVVAVGGPEDSDTLSSPTIFRGSLGSGRITSTTASLFGSYFRSQTPTARSLVAETLDRSNESWLLSTDAPAWIVMSVRAVGKDVHIHLVDLSTGVALSPRSVIASEVREAPSVDVRVEWREATAAAIQVDDVVRDVDSIVEDGFVSLHTRPFRGHAIVVIKA